MRGCRARAAQPAVSCPLGLAAWEEYPTLKMLMEMVMTKYVTACCWDGPRAGSVPGLPRGPR